MGLLNNGLVGLLIEGLRVYAGRWSYGRGTPITRHGEQFYAKVVRDESELKAAVQAVEISLDFPVQFRFRLRRETSLDRLAKRLGVAREWRTGDQDFDAGTFIVSEDRGVLAAISADGEMRKMITALLLFERGGTLECGDGRLWFTALPSEEYFDVSDELVSEQLVRQFESTLTSLRDRLLQSTSSDRPAERDPGMRRRSVLVGVSGLLGAGGIVGYFVGKTYERSEVVRETISHLSLSVTAAIVVSLLAAVLLWLRRTPSTHVVMLDILLIALPGAWFSSNAAFTCYNQEHDLATPVRAAVDVESVYSASGFGTRTYHLVVARWPGGRGDRDVSLPQKEFALINPGKCVFATLHPGRLGDTWVSGFEHAFAEDCDLTRIE